MTKCFRLVKYPQQLEAVGWRISKCAFYASNDGNDFSHDLVVRGWIDVVITQSSGTQNKTTLFLFVFVLFCFVLIHDQSSVAHSARFFLS